MERRGLEPRTVSVQTRSVMPYAPREASGDPEENLASFSSGSSLHFFFEFSADCAAITPPMAE